MEYKINLRAEVAAIKAKMASGLTYEQARKELKPHIDATNKVVQKMAKEAGMKYKKLTFEYVMR